MRFNPFRRKALTGTPQVLEALAAGWSPVRQLGPQSRQRVINAYNQAQSADLAWLYAKSPAVRTVIDVIVRNIGQLDLRLYEEVSDGGRQPAEDHPAAISLRYPNENTPGDSFIRSLFQDFLIYNNAYALMSPAPQGQLSFNRLPAASVTLGGPSAFSADFYDYYRDDGSTVRFDPVNILHWKGENPTNPRIGLSPLETLRDVIAEDVALQAVIIELAESGLADSVAIKRPLDAPEWSNEARKGFEEDIANRIRQRHRKPLVLEEGMEPISFGVSPRDAQMFEVRRWVIERVAAVYGVPLGMLGLEKPSQEAQSQFYADTIPPYCEAFTSMLNLRVLVRVYNYQQGCFEFNLDEKHMGDDRLRALTSATGRPVLLTNEARARLNLPAVEGGDELVTPRNVFVGEKPSVDVMPIQDPNGPPQDGSHRIEPPKALPQQKGSQILPMNQAADLARQDRNIAAVERVLDRHFTRLAKFVQNKKAVADWTRWDRELTGDLTEAFTQIVDKEGSIYSFKLGGEFDAGQVKHYLEAMASGGAEALHEAIRREIEADGVEGALKRLPAHTASAGASLGGGATMWARMEAARQAPGFQGRVKTWIPNTDRHAQFGGQTVPVGEAWPAGFAPGGAPGCRCSMSIS